MVGARDYSSDTVEAARSVLIEVAHALGEYRKHAVLVGGWVPSVLIERPIVPHVGSVDVDLALDVRKIGAPRYKALLQTLTDCGYSPSDKAGFQYVRDVRTRSGRTIRIPLDLLAGEYGGRGKRHQTQRIQNARARKARGADLAFERPVVVPLAGTLPDGRRDTVQFQVADPISFLVMKGMALSSRTDKPKDAYDIAWLIRHWPGGPTSLKDIAAPWLRNRLFLEGFGKIRSKFSSPDDFGPTSVVAFHEVVDAEEKARVARDAFETVRELLDRLGISVWKGV